MTQVCNISCICGKVKICLANSQPKYRLECGCCDCRQALQWASLQEGPPAPALPDLWYFRDDFTFIEGQELTKLYKLREDGASTRVVATCCFSTLLVNHPGYQNNVVMVMAQGVIMNVPKIEPLVRIQMKDFPKHRICELKPFKNQSVPLDPENLDSFGELASWDECVVKIMEIFGDTALEAEGLSMKKIMDKEEALILGLKHYEELL